MRVVTMIATCFSLYLTGCVQSANGLKFNQVTQRSLEHGQARVYLFRGRVTYLAQASAVVSARLQMDGKTIGGLKNGGFVELDVPAGRHFFTAGTQPELTAWYLDVPAATNVYFRIWDKTRMEGARATAGFAVGAAAGGVGGAEGAIANSDQIFSWSTLRSSVEAGALNGAMAGGIQGAIVGFQGRVRENEGRYWAVDLVEEAEALPVVANLSLSN